jgi:hypothetical protein
LLYLERDNLIKERKSTVTQEMLSRRDAEAKLIAKAQADHSFRQALLNSPTQTWLT